MIRLLVCLYLFQTITSQHKQRILIVGLAPFGKGQNHVGEGIKPAVEIALEDINNDEEILPRYDLDIKWIDTQCDMATTTKQLFDLYDANETRTFIFGGYCRDVTKALAETVHHFKLWQVSYAAEDPRLSNKETYPHFIRAVPSEIDMNNALVSFIKQNNWSRVSTLYQDASTGDSTFAFSHSELDLSLNRSNISIVTRESFSGDQSVNLDNIIENDGRIIIGLFNVANARQIMCKAYYKGMYGEKYVWLLPSSYPNLWWLNTSNTNCSVSQLGEAINRHFTIKVEVLDHNGSRIAVNGKPIIDYHERYNRVSGDNYNLYHGYAYDGMWLIAKLLHNTTINNRIQWEWLDNNTSISETAQTQFSGVTGNVRYINGSRLTQLSILQYIDDSLIDVGFFDMRVKKIFINNSLIMWYNDRPPSDQIVRRRDILKPKRIIQVSLTALAFLGQLLAFFFLIINIKYRKTRVIKMSSPNMNNLIIVGCLLIYSTIYMMRVDKNLVSDRLYEILCLAHAWMLSIGFTVAFGAMFSKTWRVYSIFNSPHKQKRAIKDYTLALMVAGMTTLDLALLITWTVIDPLRIKKTDLSPDKEIEQILITTVICTCDSKMINIWTSSFYAYKGVLLVAGCWFAWNTRTVTVPALNDSKYIGLSVYNVVIVCITAVAISHILREKPDYVYLIVGLLIILCTTTTLCLVFGPKVMHLRYSNQRDNKRRPTVKIKAKKPSNTVKSRQNSSKLEADVSSLERENKHLSERFQQLLATWERLTLQSKEMDDRNSTSKDNNQLSLPIQGKQDCEWISSETTTLTNNHSNATTADLTVVYNTVSNVEANEKEVLLDFLENLDLQQSTHI